MSEMKPLPEWPVESEYTVEGYRRRLAEAALARLRVAVEALEAIRLGDASPRTLALCALAAIGDLPGE
jgi:hypothetical protein